MAMSQPCPCCSTDCIKKKSVRVFYQEKFTRAQIAAKVKTRLSWVLVMILLGTCDVFINWVNFADLTSPELGRGLVLGPPPVYMWVLLLTFTIVGTVLYIPETLNTLSVFFRDSGSNFVPIIYEQLIILPFEQIPLAAINYFISRCRQKYGSTMQTLCGATSIVYIFVRIVWYAHMEGKLLQRKDDVKMKKGVFMAICALYACSMAFPIMNWRQQPGGLTSEHLEHVSLFLLKAPSLEQRRLVEQPVDWLLQSQGRDLQNPSLLKNIYEIVQAKNEGVTVDYKCDTNATFLPAECLSDGFLTFRFIYANYTEAGPYGEIVYNYAFYPAAAAAAAAAAPDSGGGSGGSGGGGSSEVMPASCVQATRNLRDGWKLFYLSYDYKRHQGFKHVLVSSPWKQTCTTPQPWYDPHIAVCPHLAGSSPAAHAHSPRVRPASRPANRTYRMAAPPAGWPSADNS